MNEIKFYSTFDQTIRNFKQLRDRKSINNHIDTPEINETIDMESPI